MKSWVAASVASLALLASSCFAADERTSAVVEISWDVSLDTSGHVTELTTKDKRVPKLHAYLEKAIRGWRFSAGKVNDQPAVTQTHLQTKLDIRVVENGVEVRVLRAATGGDYRKMTPPEYPSEVARRRKQGGVMLAVRYDETGAVTSVVTFATTPDADDGLVRAATSAVKKWRFAPEFVGGRPIAAAAKVPVCFHLDWLVPLDCDFKDPSTGESMSGGDMVALDPAAKLETDVIGRLL